MNKGTPRRKDIAGCRFGLLTVESFAYVNENGQTYWNCKCDCGKSVVRRASHLKERIIPSCGCRGGNTIHGMTGKRIYTIYNQMITRCYKPYSKSYKNYGARGITVCDEWKESFQSFYDWAVKSGYAENLSIDRIDNNGNYEPSNCRWSTPKEQANNTRRTRHITFNGETHSVSEWARILGINQSTLNMRLNKYHWTVERTLTKGVKHNVT